MLVTSTLRALRRGLALGTPTLDANVKVVQDPANATATPTASKIPIADGSGKLDGWITPLQVKVGTFTRAGDAADGSQAITGVGFTPRAILFFAYGPDKALTWGLLSASANYNTVMETSLVHSYFDLNVLSLQDNAGAQTATLTSLDADGFTLAWVKSGSPSAGTRSIAYMALR